MRALTSPCSVSSVRDLVKGGAEELLLDRLLECCRALGLVKARGQQRTDSTHVVAAVRLMHRLELVGETLRAALNDLAVQAPDWVRTVAPADWYERYQRRSEQGRLPKGKEARESYAKTVGEDGFPLLGLRGGPHHATASAGVVQCQDTPSDLGTTV